LPEEAFKKSAMKLEDLKKNKNAVIGQEARKQPLSSLQHLQTSKPSML